MARKTIDQLSAIAGDPAAADLLVVLRDGAATAVKAEAAAYLSNIPVKLHGGLTGEAARKLLPALAERSAVSVKDFGAVGDDTTDNATALTAMRDALIAVDPDRLWRIYVPAGTYRYTSNRWLQGLKRVELYGDGPTSRLRCSYWAGSTNSFNTWPLRLLIPFRTDGADTLTPNPIAEVDSGYKFDTATLPTKTITCSTAAEAANFSVGEIVLLHGYVQQFNGWPPNLRYVQWNTVTSVDGETGEIGLLHPTRHEFRDDWYDYAQNDATFGAARIKSVTDSPALYHLHIHDLEFADNDQSSYLDTLLLTGMNVRMERVTTDGVCISPRYCDYISIEDCDIHHSGSHEFDKGLGYVKIRNSRLSAGTGSAVHHCNAEVLDIENCQLLGALRVSPRRLRLVNSKIAVDSSDASIISKYSNSWPSVDWMIEGNEISVGGGAFSYYLENGAGLTAATVDSVGAGNEIEIDALEDWSSPVQQWTEGTFLATEDGAKRGVLKRIYDDAGTAVFEVDTKQTVEAADVWYGSGYQRVVWRNNRVIGPKKRFIARHFAQMSSTPGEAEIVRLVFGRDMNLDDALWSAVADSNCQAFVDKILVNVEQAYTGSDTAPLLKIQRMQAVDRWVGHVDLATAGLRTIDASGVAGSTGADDFNVSSEAAADTMGTWFHQLRVFPARSGGMGLTGDDADLPRGWVEFHIRRSA